MHRSHQDFYVHMKKCEDQRNQRMLQLLIDKEKKEISELKSNNIHKR